MDPKPDYGYDSYKGTGKLKGKVTATTYIHITRRHAHDVHDIYAVHAAAAAAAVGPAAVFSRSQRLS